MDPMNPSLISVQDDATIQIRDGLKPSEPSDLTYKDDKFGNAIKAATFVAEDEAIHPDLDVGADKLAHHRRLLRDLSCLQESLPSPDKSGNPKP